MAPVKVQTEFTVKLMKFDETKKVALIKEIKALIEGMNLVQVQVFYYFKKDLSSNFLHYDSRLRSLLKVLPR